MDLPIFLAKLAMLSRFPDALRQYAENVGSKVRNAERATLMTKLEAQYAQFVKVDDERIRREEEMLEELVAFKKKNLPPLQKKIQKAEEQAAEFDLDAQLKKQ